MPITTLYLDEEIGDRIAVSPREAARLLSVSVPTMYELLNSGRVPSVKVGHRRLVSVAGLHALVNPGGDSGAA